MEGSWIDLSGAAEAASAHLVVTLSQLIVALEGSRDVRADRVELGVTLPSGVRSLPPMSSDTARQLEAGLRLWLRGLADESRVGRPRAVRHLRAVSAAAPGLSAK
ncbi:hypothetical protein GCM10009544_16050 [Streptomyces stramineus]|uniref:Uncharacterized protein n=1 Tax=Streptomyces stramineus TaxID=173861 RepID=A0ABP3JHU6_9ACTN